ncbi:glycosyltransferase family 4 protein [Peristeroidobacter soli]|uniref:glycosyltransferase family 4 protein n=1 Tax=Peristeroidobacter soli TaxID=2497877 RepID=UPI00101B96A3|nr:glycosyltransferase family 4 protein [Peristeroidobacter soli]
MRIALISTDYPPLRSSAAVQLRDLAQELKSQGHEPIVLVPSEALPTAWARESLDGIEVIRLAAPRTRGTGYFRRALGEAWLPFAMLKSLRRSPWHRTRWDGVVWYSPTIFFGPLIHALKAASKCRSYLILRDIFPEWALDLQLLRKGPAYYFFKCVARYQYRMADVIGVQSPSNLAYLRYWAQPPRRRLEVLQNWLAPAPDIGCSIDVQRTALAGRKILLYIGNMGVAQGLDIFIDVAEQLQRRKDIGFLFVGRGTDAERLSALAQARKLDNILFHSEIDSREMPGLLAQAHIGLLALDPRHKTHNVPGKFLTYVQCGLPVLARVSAGTDIVDLIEREAVGRVYVGELAGELSAIAESMVDDQERGPAMSRRGRELSELMFSPRTAVNQIIAGLAGRDTESVPSTEARSVARKQVQS